MSAEVQSAVFSVEDGIGWHGIGLAIPEDAAKDPRKIAEILGATWSVERRECFYKANNSFARVEGSSVLVRDDTGEALSVVSANRYHIDNRQPVDILEAFRDDLQRENLTISHAAVLKRGAVIIVSAKLPVEHRVNGNDPVQFYQTLGTSYNKTLGSKSLVSAIRVVCHNTDMAATRDASERGRIKTIRASTRLEESSLSDLLLDTRTLVECKKKAYDALANTKMSDQAVSRYFADVLQINIDDLGKRDKNGKALIATKSENMLKSLIDAYRHAPGAESAKGTAWGAFNAVTYFATHEKTCRDTTDEGALQARVASNMFGDAARLKSRALELIAA